MRTYLKSDRSDFNNAAAKLNIQYQSATYQSCLQSKDYH